VCPDASKNGRISLSAIVRSARITTAIRAARRSCQKAAKTQKSTFVWGSSGESRLNRFDLQPTSYKIFLMLRSQVSATRGGNNEDAQCRINI
jgi:hypothetical protein